MSISTVVGHRRGSLALRRTLLQLKRISVTMQNLKNLAASAFTLLLVAASISSTLSAPKGNFQRRNWTPHSMMYLKGTQGRRFIPEDMKDGDLFDAVHLETRSQDIESLSVSKAAAVLLRFLQRAREEGEEGDPQGYFPGAVDWKQQDYY